jgi:phosphohistidine phosphatase
MKTLLVLRHAKASQDSPSSMDFDRPLKPRGRAQALALGGMVRDRQLAFDAIVASPAARVVETVTGIMDGAGLGLEPAYDRRLYNASPETLLEVIREAGNTVERLLIVGHNPGLQHLLLHIAEDDGDGLRDEITSGFPTAALAELQLSVDRWREIGRRSGRIVRLVRPEA